VKPNLRAFLVGGAEEFDFSSFSIGHHSRTQAALFAIALRVNVGYCQESVM